jgi:hypothetical protein
MTFPEIVIAISRIEKGIAEFWNRLQAQHADGMKDVSPASDSPM